MIEPTERPQSSFGYALEYVVACSVAVGLALVVDDLRSGGGMFHGVGLMLGLLVAAPGALFLLLRFLMVSERGRPWREPRRGFFFLTQGVLCSFVAVILIGLGVNHADLRPFMIAAALASAAGSVWFFKLWTKAR